MPIYSIFWAWKPCLLAGNSKNYRLHLCLLYGFVRWDTLQNYKNNGDDNWLGCRKSWISYTAPRLNNLIYYNYNTSPRLAHYLDSFLSSPFTKGTPPPYFTSNDHLLAGSWSLSTLRWACTSAEKNTNIKIPNRIGMILIWKTLKTTWEMHIMFGSTSKTNNYRTYPGIAKTAPTKLRNFWLWHILILTLLIVYLP